MMATNEKIKKETGILFNQLSSRSIGTGYCIESAIKKGIQIEQERSDKKVGELIDSLISYRETQKKNKNSWKRKIIR